MVKSGVSALAVAFCLAAAPANAQDMAPQAGEAAPAVEDATPAEPDAAAGGDDIVVTGSRITRNGYTAPTPVTAVTTEQLVQATPSNIPDALNKLPIFSGSRGQRTIDRPAVLSDVARQAAGLIADFGSGDAALLDALTGRVPPEGRLPFELPRSEAAVTAQAGDLPHDSASPLFPIGYGLTLAGAPLAAARRVGE